MHFVFAAWIVVGGLVLKDVETKQFDAPIPDRCATFDKATDSTNGNATFCKRWFADHAVVKPATQQ